MNSENAEALRCLASLMRTGLSLPQAMAVWHVDAPPSLRAPLQRGARRLALGIPPADAFSATGCFRGDDGAAFATAVRLHISTGADLAAMLDDMAAVLEERDAASASARAAAAGAALSARVVTALPLVFVVLVPLPAARVLDAPGVAMTVVGAALAITGMWWMHRLLPRGEDLHDDVALVAERCRAVLRGGTGLHHALEEIARRPPRTMAAVLRTCRTEVMLGRSWTEALGRCADPGLRALGSVLTRSVAKGIPAIPALDAFAAAREATARRAFEARVRRAAVLVVLPLVVCVLPSYLLLGVAPFLRSLSP